MIDNSNIKFFKIWYWFGWSSVNGIIDTKLGVIIMQNKNTMVVAVFVCNLLSDKEKIVYFKTIVEELTYVKISKVKFIQ